MRLGSGPQRADPALPAVISVSFQDGRAAAAPLRRAMAAALGPGWDPDDLSPPEIIRGGSGNGEEGGKEAEWTHAAFGPRDAVALRRALRLRAARAAAGEVESGLALSAPAFAAAANAAEVYFDRATRVSPAVEALVCELAVQRCARRAEREVASLAIAAVADACRRGGDKALYAAAWCAGRLGEICAAAAAAPARLRAAEEALQNERAHAEEQLARLEDVERARAAAVRAIAAAQAQAEAGAFDDDGSRAGAEASTFAIIL